MKKFGLFLLIVAVVAILGGGIFIAFWDMPIHTTMETKDVTKELTNGQSKN